MKTPRTLFLLMTVPNDEDMHVDFPMDTLEEMEETFERRYIARFDSLSYSFASHGALLQNGYMILPSNRRIPAPLTNWHELPHDQRWAAAFRDAYLLDAQALGLAPTEASTSAEGTDFGSLLYFAAIRRYIARHADQRCASELTTLLEAIKAQSAPMDTETALQTLDLYHLWIHAAINPFSSVLRHPSHPWSCYNLADEPRSDEILSVLAAEVYF